MAPGLVLGLGSALALGSALEQLVGGSGLWLAMMSALGLATGSALLGLTLHCCWRRRRRASHYRRRCRGVVASDDWASSSSASLSSLLSSSSSRVYQGKCVVVVVVVVFVVVVGALWRGRFGLIQLPTAGAAVPTNDTQGVRTASPLLSPLQLLSQLLCRSEGRHCVRAGTARAATTAHEE